MRHSGHRERTRARARRTAACPFRRVTGRGRQHTTHTSIWRHEFHCRSQRCLRDVIVRLTPLRRGRRRRPMRDDSSSCCRRMNFVPIAAPRSRPRPGKEGERRDGQIALVRAATSQLAPGCVSRMSISQTKSHFCTRARERNVMRPKADASPTEQRSIKGKTVLVMHTPLWDLQVRECMTKNVPRRKGRREAGRGGSS